MTNKCFTMGGYSFLYSSLMEYHNINEPDAIELLELLCEANIISHSQSPPFDDYGGICFRRRLLSNPRRPYHTEVQFYKAMQALHGSIDTGRVDENQRQALEHLYNIMGEIEYEFLRVYGMEIDDKRTVYEKCVDDLTPRRGEPTVCLLCDLAA